MGDNSVKAPSMLLLRTPTARSNRGKAKSRRPVCGFAEQLASPPRAVWSPLRSHRTMNLKPGQWAGLQVRAVSSAYFSETSEYEGSAAEGGSEVTCELACEFDS